MSNTFDEDESLNTPHPVEAPAQQQQLPDFFPAARCSAPLDVGTNPTAERGDARRRPARCQSRAENGRGGGASESGLRLGDRVRRRGRELVSFYAHRAYIPIFVSFFSFVGGIALIMPLVGVFLHDRGIGADEIALFGFVAALLSFVSRSAFAILADRIGFHRLITAGVVLMSGLSFTLMLLVPKREDSKEHSQPMSNTSTQSISNASDGAAHITTDALAAQHVPSAWRGLDIRMDASFWIAFVTRTFGIALFNPVINLSDSLTFAVIARVLRAQSETAKSTPPTLDSPTPDSIEDEHEDDVQKDVKEGADSAEGSENFSRSSSSGNSPPHEREIVERAKRQSEGCSVMLNVLGEKVSSEILPEGQIQVETGDSARALLAEPAAAPDGAHTSSQTSIEEAQDGQRVRAYSTFRAFGSFGFLVTSGVAALITLFVVRANPSQTYLVSVLVADAFWLLCAASFLFFRTGRIHADPNLFRSISKFIGSPPVLRFLALIFTQGILYGILETNLFLFLNMLGGPALCYAAGFACMISEVVVIGSAHLLIGRLGHTGAQLLVLGTYVLRFTGYAFIPGAWWNLPFDMLQGFTTGLQLVSMAATVATLAPPAMQPSAQGVTQGVFWGPGIACGYLVGGFLFQLFGPRVLWWSSAGIALGALLVFGLIHFLTRRRKATSAS